MKLLIKNGTLVQARKEPQQLDILVENGHIAALGNLPEEGCETINAQGKHVFPGFIDMHVHLREPGFTGKETVETGTRAAAAGGFTGVACMPNTNPVTDNLPVLQYILQKAQEAGLCRVYPIAAITKGQKGEELSEMRTLYKGGAVAFSDDGRPVVSSRIMRLALEYAKDFGGLLISHSEDADLSGPGVMHEGYYSEILGLPGIPAEAEAIMAKRDIMLANMLGTRVHIAHVSSAVTLHEIRQAKKQGVAVTCETCPHYFSADHSAALGYNTFAKVNPPLRTKADMQAVVEALQDGTIDVLATDHAPHTAADKNGDFLSAAFGISGLETAFSLAYTHLVKPGHIGLSQLANLLSAAPARILGVTGGSLSVGAPADIAIADLNAEYTIDAARFYSKGKNTPFQGQQVSGRIVCTLLEGRQVFKA